MGNGKQFTSIGIGMRRLLSSGIVQDPGRILGVQTHSATPLYNSWRCAGDGDPVMADEWLKCYVPQTKHIPGLTAASAQDIGDPASFKKVIREIGGYRETEGISGAMEVAEEKDLRAALSAAKDGLEVCPQTAVVFAGLRTAVAKGIVGAGSRVVVVSTAHMMVTDAAVAASGNEIKEITRVPPMRLHGSRGIKCLKKQTARTSNRPRRIFVFLTTNYLLPTTHYLTTSRTQSLSSRG